MDYRWIGTKIKLLKNMDEFLYKVPLIGSIIKKQYSYFRNHMALTDLFHLLAGFGLALIFFTSRMLLGFVILGFSILYHLYAILKVRD